MNRLEQARHQQLRRQLRVRATVKGTTERPRLSVRVSNLHVSAQVIDDTTHKTILSSTTTGQKLDKANMTDKAVWVGKDVATKAKKAKISKLTFDRGSKLYHGRIKALADTLRNEGLEL